MKKYILCLMIVFLNVYPEVSSASMDEKIAKECGTNPVISYIKDIKESVIDPQILTHAKECAGGDLEGKILKWSIGDANIQGCLEREYKYTPEYIKKIAPLVDDAQKNTEGIMGGYNQCVNNMYKCKRRFCREERKEKEAFTSEQLDSKQQELVDLSRDYSSLRKKYLEFEKNLLIERREFLPEGVFDQNVYNTYLAGKLSNMGGQMQRMLLLTSIMPVVSEISDGAEEIGDGLDDIEMNKITNMAEYREMVRESKNISARSKAILIELMDSTKRGG